MIQWRSVVFARHLRHQWRMSLSAAWHSKSAWRRPLRRHFLAQSAAAPGRQQRRRAAGGWAATGAATPGRLFPALHRPHCTSPPATLVALLQVSKSLVPKSYAVAGHLLMTKLKAD